MAFLYNSNTQKCNDSNFLSRVCYFSNNFVNVKMQFKTCVFTDDINNMVRKAFQH